MFEKKTIEQLEEMSYSDISAELGRAISSNFLDESYYELLNFLSDNDSTNVLSDIIVKKYVRNEINQDMHKCMHSAGINMEFKHELNWTLVHYMVCIITDDSYSNLKFLIENGFNINARDDFGISPLHFSTIRNDAYNKCKSLILNGADLEAKTIKGTTPLHIAAKNGRLATSKLLISAGADIHTLDVNGKTPLHLAAYYGNVKVAKVLISAGASSYALDNDGKTPWDLGSPIFREQVPELNPNA